MTFDERSVLRAKLRRKYGRDDTIQESTRNDVFARLSTVYTLQREEFTCHMLAWDIMPRLETTSRQCLDVEDSVIRQYGNPPHSHGSRANQYRFELFAN